MSRRLLLILGDQLDRQSPLLQAADKRQDVIVMLEARNESERIPSHKARTTLFLSAMRHHAAWLEAQGYRVDYTRIDRNEAASFTTALEAAIERHSAAELCMVAAGEHGVHGDHPVFLGKGDLALYPAVAFGFHFKGVFRNLYLFLHALHCVFHFFRNSLRFFFCLFAAIPQAQ